ncbi:MAG: phosphotransferase-like protein [Nocardioides sp.]
MTSGRLVLLNGPSSAGKTTLAVAVADRLATPWLVMPVDLFHQIRTRPPGELSEESWQQVFRRTRAAYHRALAGAVDAGCDVLGDHALSEPWRLDDLLDLTAGQDVLLVHVHCDLDELDRRERARADRDPGTARAQAALVFAHGDCDLVVDTTDGVDGAAGEVASLIAHPPGSRAFDRMREKGGQPAAETARSCHQPRAKGTTMSVARDVMNRGAQCLTEDQTLLDAARYMKDLGIGSLPIQAADGNLTGMVTDRDIVVRCVADGASPADVKAGALATGGVQTADVDDSIDDVLQVMREHQVKRMPVLAEGKIVGMISESDLVAALTSDQVGHFAQGVYKKD